MADVKGRKIAVLATDGVEQVELTAPVKALKEAGAEPTVVAPHGGQIQAMNHHDKGDKLKVDAELAEARPISSTDCCFRAGSPTPTSCAWTTRRWRSSGTSWRRTSRSPLSAMDRGP